jgi:hypothetical protein
MDVRRPLGLAYEDSEETKIEAALILDIVHE